MSDERRYLIGIDLGTTHTALAYVDAQEVSAKKNAPAAIRMACFGPVRPGQRGHPMAGQTVEVFRPEAIAGHFGNTGSRATSIVAFFGPPPPAPAPATPAASTVTFKTYGVVKKIPISLLLPCGGTGVVSFVPLPKSPPTSRDATVRVSYVGQP